jgi:hypothetical protein
MDPVVKKPFFFAFKLPELESPMEEKIHPEKNLGNSLDLEVPIRLADLAERERMLVIFRLLKGIMPQVLELFDSDWENYDDSEFKLMVTEIRAYLESMNKALSLADEDK